MEIFKPILNETNKSEEKNEEIDNLQKSDWSNINSIGKSKIWAAKKTGIFDSSKNSEPNQEDQLAQNANFSKPNQQDQLAQNATFSKPKQSSGANPDDDEIVGREATEEKEAFEKEEATQDKVVSEREEAKEEAENKPEEEKKENSYGEEEISPPSSDDSFF